MTSLWTDLLFLHGHLVRKEDLAWRRDVAPKSDDTEAARSSASASAPAPALPANPSRESGTAACA